MLTLKQLQRLAAVLQHCLYHAQPSGATWLPKSYCSQLLLDRHPPEPAAHQQGRRRQGCAGNGDLARPLSRSAVYSGIGPVCLAATSGPTGLCCV